MKQRLIIAITTSLILLLSMVSFLLGTTPGLYLTINLANKLLAGNLSVAKAQGRLLDNAVLSHLSYQTDAYVIEIEQLNLNWQLWRLVTGHLPIKQFSTKQLSVSAVNKLGQRQPKLQLATANLAGNYGLTRHQPLALTTRWQGLQAFASPQHFVHDGTGTLTTQGSRANYTWQLTAKLPGTGLPDSDWQLAGQGNLIEIALNQLQIKVLDGLITGQGHYDGQTTWQLNLHAKHLNPAVQWRDIPGNINFNLAGNGNAQQQIIELSQLSGQLHQQALTGQAHFIIEAKSLTHSRLALQAGTAKITLQGQVTHAWDLQWDIKIADLSTLITHGNGSFYDSGSITGPRSQPRIKTQLKGQRLQLGSHQLQAIQAEGYISLDRQQASQFDLTLEKLRSAPFAIDHIQLALRGTLAQQRLTGSLVTPTEHFSLKLTSQQTPTQWLVRVPHFSMQSKRLGNWQLNTPLQAIIGNKYTEIKPVCWQAPHQRLCLQQTLIQDAHHWTLKWQGQHLDLALINPWLPAIVKLQGHSDFSLNAAATQDKKTNAQLDLAIGVMRIHYAADPHASHSLVAEGIKASATMSQRGFKAQLQGIVLDQPLRASLKLPGFNQLALPGSNQPMGGEFNFTLPDLSILSGLIPNVTDIGGALQLQLRLAGNLAKPQLIGTANLKNGKFTLPEYGTHIEQLQGTATGRNDGKVSYQFTAKAGPNGHLELTGNADLFAGPVTTKSNLTGTQALAVNLDQYQVVADPHLEFLTRGPQMNLTGSIYIPAATLKPTDFSQNVVELPDDVVIIGGKPTATSGPIPFSMQLKLKLGQQVIINARGLSGNVQGNLVIHEQPQRPTTADGQLNILNGTYKVYGETLTIRHGRLIFAGGPINNPGLYIQAARTIRTSLFDELTVGVNARGQLKQPQVSLFSEPANISQADILSYILTGSPISRLGGAKGQLLFKAATALNPVGGSDQIGNLKKDLQTNLGLDELDVGTVQQYSAEKGMMVQNTSLMLGKQLTHRLHLNYSVGIAEHINTLTLRYQLWKRLLLQTQTTGDSSGVDIIYTIERK